MSILMTLAVPGIPLIVLGWSYLQLKREFGTWRLWNVHIHESGRRTLKETVFYYDHFLRELPIDTLYAWAILNSHDALGSVPPLPSVVAALSQLSLALFIGWVVVGSVRSVGARASLADLVQFHETDTRAGWGTHWQMHFLSTLATLLLLVLPAAFHDSTQDFVLRLQPLAGAFVVLTLMFRTGARAVTDRRWILHGAREILTYALMVGLPWLLPNMLVIDLSGPLWNLPVLASLVTLVVIAGYLLIVFLQSDLNAEASSPRGLSFLLASHFFEHILDYVYIALLVLTGLAWTSGR